uniref:THD domain-containing protein n=1 Tax=Denticeps clupeoides TaxID=299321 RepID=A0AAY4BRL9_9TELE
MAHGAAAPGYPQVFVVDPQAARGPPPGAARARRPGWKETLLCLVVAACVLGVAVEAGFIYRLCKVTFVLACRVEQDRSTLGQAVRVSQRYPPQTISDHVGVGGWVGEALSSFPGSNPPVNGSTLQWSTGSGTFIHGMKYAKNGSLAVAEEGWYYFYSKVSFNEPQCSAVKYKMMKRTPRYKNPIEVVRSLSYRCIRSQTTASDIPDRANSFLHAAVYMHTDESVYVEVEVDARRGKDVVIPGVHDNVFGGFKL